MLNILEFTPKWHEDAACRGVGSDIFFVERGQSTEPARQYCDTCPVRQECEMDGYLHNDKHGIWGGLTTQDRKAKHKKMIEDGELDPALKGSLKIEL